MDQQQLGTFKRQPTGETCTLTYKFEIATRTLCYPYLKFNAHMYMYFQILTFIHEKRPCLTLLSCLTNLLTYTLRIAMNKPLFTKTFTEQLSLILNSSNSWHKHSNHFDINKLDDHNLRWYTFVHVHVIAKQCSMLVSWAKNNYYSFQKSLAQQDYTRLISQVF